MSENVRMFVIATAFFVVGLIVWNFVSVRTNITSTYEFTEKPIGIQDIETIPDFVFDEVQLDNLNEVLDDTSGGTVRESERTETPRGPVSGRIIDLDSGKRVSERCSKAHGFRSG